MRHIALLDTSIATDNLGDGIIMDAVRDVISEVMPDAFCASIPTHDYMGRKSRKLVRAAQFSIVGGSNIMQPDIWSRTSLWKLSLADAMALQSVILLGVGWRGYGKAKVEPATRWFFDRVLSSTGYHSARDQYTADKLAQITDRVLNTACVTMWRLTPDFCAGIPRQKADQVVTMLTHYKAKPEADRQMLELLLRRYKTVHFWPQQFEDMEYFQKLGVAGIRVMPSNLASYNRLLETQDVDFVGARLHGGVRAMQKGRRALIIAVDNRATEISRDTGLPIVAHGEGDPIEQWIDAGAATNIHLPQAAIDLWKGQFQATAKP